MALRRGLKSLRAGELDRAEAHFSRAYRWAPTQPEVCYALGRERLRQGRIDEGEQLLAAAWSGDTTLVSAAATLARSYAQNRGDYARAHALLDEASRVAPPDAVDTLLVVRAEMLIDEGRIVEARTAAEAALTQANYETTEGAARAALARIFNQEGIDLANAGCYERALFCFKRAADHDPAWSSPHVNIGACFIRLDKPAPALTAYRAAVALEPDNAIAHYNLGLLHRELGDGEAARRALQAAIDADPANANEARSALAAVCLSDGDPDSAIELLSAIVGIAPEDSDAWVDLGLALNAAGDRDGAETCFRQALDIDPDHEHACTRLADLLARDARYLEAAVLAERATDIANRKRRRL